MKWVARTVGGLPPLDVHRVLLVRKEAEEVDQDRNVAAASLLLHGELMFTRAICFHPQPSAPPPLLPISPHWVNE